MKSKWNNVGEEAHGRICIGTIGVTVAGKVFPVRCGKWSCPVCAPLNALREAIRCANGIGALRSEGVTGSFITLTQPPSVKTASFAYSILPKQWNTLRMKWTRWANERGLPFDYAAFVEGQSRRAGMPHFHIIGTFAPSKETLRQWAVQSGLGYQVDRQELGASNGAAWYVSKYSTKSSDAAFMPKGFRRVRYSEDFPKMKFRTDETTHEAIVKRPKESVDLWAFRASVQLHIDISQIVERAYNLLDAANQTELSLTIETRLGELMEIL